MEGICGVCLGRERFLRRGAVEGSRGGSFLCFQPQGVGGERNWCELPLKGLWTKTTLSQAARAAGAWGKALVTGKELHHSSWLCAALGLPTDAHQSWNEQLPFYGWGQHISVTVENHEILESCPHSLHDKIQCAILVGNRWEK